MDVIMNIAALGEVEAKAAERDKLAKLRASASKLDSTSDGRMFGNVPSGAQAAKVLRDAVTSLAQQASEGGQAVDDIRSSAATAAQIGEQSDMAAEQALAQARRSVLA
ncbi:hypothetical protein [Streptomyces sp. 6N223]|uniref:hypothetical protein n=1 Tax=Streptomyces sp. 6N223 TaxID=3457412 RepID=UPI003FD12F34